MWVLGLPPEVESSMLAAPGALLSGGGIRIETLGGFPPGVFQSHSS